MLSEYIKAALHQAQYEMIEDEEPFYGEIPALPGVWATGQTLESCRDNLASTLEGWLLVRLSRNLAIPPLGDVTLEPPKALKVA